MEEITIKNGKIKRTTTEVKEETIYRDDIVAEKERAEAELAGMSTRKTELEEKVTYYTNLLTQFDEQNV